MKKDEEMSLASMPLDVSLERERECVCVCVLLWSVEITSALGWLDTYRVEVADMERQSMAIP